MSNRDERPDTRTMAIVHAALQRDLERTVTELTTTPYPQGRQQRALAEHVRWLMRFLHDHHTSEDLGLWPLVRSHNPAAAPLLDSLEQDHARVAPSITRVTAAADAYVDAGDDTARMALATEIETLLSVLLPHLDREVREAMPVVAETLSAAEWHDWDNRFNIKPKSARELGITGHWMIDGIDPEGRRLVVGLVPPVPRFVLLHGFARIYRREAQARWRPTTAATMPAWQHASR